MDNKKLAKLISNLSWCGVILVIILAWFTVRKNQILYWGIISFALFISIFFSPGYALNKLVINRVKHRK
ncbi:MAG: hypothetical protein DUD34_10690 [Lactobacillus sp.]|nr:MAG: hypothetical protein DUD34_10690 [Lactobacillus sp.]